MYRAILTLVLVLALGGCTSGPKVCKAPPVSLSDDGSTVITSYDHIRVVQGIHMAFFRMRWRAKTTHTPKGRDYHVDGLDTKDRVILVRVKQDNGVYHIEFSGSPEASTGAALLTQCLEAPNFAYFADD